MTSQSARPERYRAQIDAGGATHAVSYFDRQGSRDAVVFVHGLGNGAENFESMCEQPSLNAHRLIAMDLPGCGETPYPSDRTLSIDDLVDLVERFIDDLELDRIVLVGASMGGLIALLYAARRPERVRAFVNAEGNLMPEDCMFSRRVIGYTFDEFVRVAFPKIKSDVGARRGRGFDMHRAVLERANPRAYYDYSFQTVLYSDHGALLERFLALPIPDLHFVHGSMNASLSYLPRLRDSRCVMTEIPEADHFMFYDNPTAFAECVGRALL
jgi:pimeloyl-ACP methyl ester carboxylesterase